MPTTMHNTASGDGGMDTNTQSSHLTSRAHNTQTFTCASARAQTHTHAQTLTVMRHGAVYAHIKRKSLISVTGRALAPKELANSPALHRKKHIHNKSGVLAFATEGRERLIFSFINMLNV